MRIFDDFHSWNVKPCKAIELQKELVNKLSPGRLHSGAVLIAGVDVSVRHGLMSSPVVVWLPRKTRLKGRISWARIPPFDKPFDSAHGQRLKVG